MTSTILQNKTKLRCFCLGYMPLFLLFGDVTHNLKNNNAEKINLITRELNDISVSENSKVQDLVGLKVFFCGLLHFEETNAFRNAFLGHSLITDVKFTLIFLKMCIFVGDM